MSWDKRENTRHKCKLRVRIRARGNVYDGHLFNISTEGMRISTDGVADIWSGDEVEVIGPGFGSVVGTARWREPGQLGMKFHKTAFNAANLRVLWRHFGLPI